MKRAALAVAVYLPLALAWKLTSLDLVMDRLLAEAAGRLHEALAHFPLGADVVNTVRHRNQALVVPFAAACAVSVRGLAAVARVRRYGAIALAVLAGQVCGLALQIGLDLALRFETSNGIALMAAWERALVVRTIQLLFLTGIQIAPFVLLALTVVWSGEKEPRRRMNRRQATAAWGIAIVTLLAAGTVFHLAREAGEGHVAAHRRIGRAFAAQAQWTEAERQLRRVVRSDPADGEAWSILATAVERQGRVTDARRIRRRALEAVSDPE